MDKQHTFDAIRQLIGSGKTGEAFDFLRKQSLDPAFTRSLAIIEAEYNELRQAEIKGILSPENIQLRKNQINDKILALFQEGPYEGVKNPAKRKLLKIVLPFALFGMIFLVWWGTREQAYSCPAFPEEVNNKILVIPFINIGNQPAKPEISLRDRINQLTKNYNLSSVIKLGNAIDDITIDEAPSLADQCGADLLVWGTYSSRADSIHLVLQYFFAHEPEWSNSGELITLKDVTAIQTGSMLKNLEDAIMSLCGILAMREGNNEVAKNWFDKVNKKEAVDRRMLEALKH